MTNRTNLILNQLVFGLQVLLVASKLDNVINWDWLWILAPLWISYGLSLIINISIKE